MIVMRIEVNIPEGKSGNFEIAHYSNETTDNNWLSYLRNKKERHLTHTVLLKDGLSMPIMQDSEAEYNEHSWLWKNAEGDVLIGGLGIGMTHHVLINNPKITSVTIIEKYQDVIDLVWDNCVKDDRFSIVKADIYTWDIPDGSHWNVGWFDTWIGDGELSRYKQSMIDKYSMYIDKMNGWFW